MLRLAETAIKARKIWFWGDVMNYLQELNAFRDWTLLNHPSTGQIALWYSLMSIDNMTGWQEWFTVANQTLQLMTGMSKAGLDKARGELINKGLVQYKSGSTKQAGKYRLVSIYNKKVDQWENNGRTISRPMGEQWENNGKTINKLNINETKLEEINAPLLLPPGITDAEREILNKLKAVSGYPFDYAKDLEFIRELAVDYPAIDILEQVKKYAVWLLDNPYKAKSNPRLQFRNWCKNSVKWADKKTFEPVRGGKKQTIEEKLRVLEGY